MESLVSISALAHLDQIGRLPLLLLFLCLHLIIGAALPVRAGGKPFLWMLFGNAGREIARRLNKSSRTPAALRQRGRIVIVIMVSFAGLIGLAAERLAIYPYGWLVQFILLAAGITALLPGKVLGSLEKIPEKSFAQQAAEKLQPYHLEDLDRLDAYTLRRKAVMWAAKSLVRYLAVPSFFFLLAGITGFCIGIALLALSEAYSNLRKEYGDIGGPLRRLDKIIVWIPAALTSLVIAMSSLFVSRGNLFRSLNVFVKQSGKYKPSQDGVVIAATAGALDITLGGPVRYPDGHVVSHGWIGAKTSSAQVIMSDLQRARLLFFVSFLWFIIALSAVLSVVYVFHK